MWWLLFLIPKNLLSRLVGVIVRVAWPWPFRLWILRWFAGRYQINLSEAEFELGHYRSIQDLFVRKLKPGLRPIAEGPVVHPVDGALTVASRVEKGLGVQVKGLTYNIAELLGEPELDSTFEGGQALTYYLCPTDYHRVHSPIDGVITGAHYIPGNLWPVNEWSVQNISGLFVRNERVVVWMRSAYGPVALVMVGATNVGQMTMAFDSSLVTNQGHVSLKKNYDPEIRVSRGEEVGVFNMGSTVVMVYPNSFPLELGPLPRSVRMGAALTER